MSRETDPRDCQHGQADTEQAVIDRLRAEISRLTAENERLSALSDRWNAECDEMREDNKRLAAELAEAKSQSAFWQEEVKLAEIRHQDELAELRAQEPVEIHQWRGTYGDGRWRDATKEEAYSRVDSEYEARTLYARPIPAAQAVPDDGSALLHAVEAIEAQKGRS